MDILCLLLPESLALIFCLLSIISLFTESCIGSNVLLFEFICGWGDDITTDKRAFNCWLSCWYFKVESMREGDEIAVAGDERAEDDDGEDNVFRVDCFCIIVIEFKFLLKEFWRFIAWLFDCKPTTKRVYKVKNIRNL